MVRRQLTTKTAFAVAIMLLLAGCHSATPRSRPSPTPRPPIISGELLVAGDHGLELLTQSADGTLAVTHSIDATHATQLFGLNVAPDGHAVTYTRDGDLFLRTLPDGVERQLASHAGCASWAPDGRHLSYLHEDDGLIVTDLQGHLTVVDRVKHETYGGA